jgi:hypothetical protein
LRQEERSASSYRPIRITSAKANFSRRQVKQPFAASTNGPTPVPHREHVRAPAVASSRFRHRSQKSPRGTPAPHAAHAGGKISRNNPSQALGLSEVAAAGASAPRHPLISPPP